MAQGLTVAALEALRRAYFEGALSVQYGDKRVVYRSLAEMRRLIDEAEGELAGELGNQGRGRRSRIATDKGTNG